MNRILVAISVLAIVSGAAAAPAPRPAAAGLTGAAILAKLPADKLAQIPQPTLDAVLNGEIPAAEFAASLGMGRARINAMTTLQQKQFITHWLYHYDCIPGGIDDDLVNEATIDGRCSEQKMADGANAPSVGPGYWGSGDGTIGTYYYSAPYDSSTCSYTTTNVSRYWVTWVATSDARSAYLFFGSSDYFKVWLNGSLVVSRTSGGPKSYVEDEYKTPVNMVRHWNLIVVKQSFPQLGPSDDPSSDNKYKYFALRFCSDASGTPITDLTAMFDPTCSHDDDAAIYSRVWVPLAAHLGGVGGSQWRSDYTVMNGTHFKWLLNLAYFKEGNNSGTPNATYDLVLNPFQIVTMQDVLPTIFAQGADQKGYVIIRGQYENNLWGMNNWLLAKVYNQGPAGTFGMVVPGLYVWDASTWWVFFGVRNGQYRSNLAMFPTHNNGATADVQVTVFGPDIPAVINKTYTGIKGFWQLNNIFGDMGIGSITTNNAVVEVQIENNVTGTNWFPFITVNDGNPSIGLAGTSDPVYIYPNSYGYSATPPELN